MLVICLSSIALAAEDPVDEKSATNQFLEIVDYAFTGVFAAEMLLKVRAWLRDYMMMSSYLKLLIDNDMMSYGGVLMIDLFLYCCL